jgi:2-oxo-4-hydroxy-4-carboxy-5-ureidoimidazoline decarboxylase
MTLAELNAGTREQFVAALGDVFEDSPWVPDRAWIERPFRSFDDLSTRLIRVVQSATGDEQLALLQAYRSSAEDDAMRSLGGEYRKKFGFPFLHAVKEGDQAATIEALKRRLKSAPDQEFQVALGHVFRMARFRLEDIIR